ncbi:unnamed protein product [Arctogadus glacialis]
MAFKDGDRDSEGGTPGGDERTPRLNDQNMTSVCHPRTTEHTPTFHPLSWRGTAPGHKGSSSGPVQGGSDLREPSPRSSWPRPSLFSLREASISGVGVNTVHRELHLVQQSPGQPVADGGSCSSRASTLHWGVS